MTFAGFVTNDTAGDLVVALTDKDGNALNVAGASARIHLLRPDGTVLDVPATLTTGQATYSWQTGDLSVAGDWKGEVEVTYSGGKKQTTRPKFDFPVDNQIA